MMNLWHYVEKLNFKVVAHIVGILVIIGATIYVMNKKEVEYRSDRDKIIAVYSNEIARKDSALLELKREQQQLLAEVDSLEKVKQTIIIDYGKEVNVIFDATAADHALWLDSVLIDLGS